MRQLKYIFLIVAFCIAGCTAFQNSDMEKQNTETTEVTHQTETVIYQMTDLHYLSSSLNDNGEMFQKVILNADGKLTEYTPDILSALIQRTVADHPDALLVSGDITFNGEKQSLIDVCQAFRQVQDAGIPVLIIPGNHDIDYPYAAKYEGNSYTAVENMSTEDFISIAGDYGYRDAQSHDENSCSYFYELNSSVAVLALDANSSKNHGRVSEETLTWAEGQLKKAQENNQMVISLTHQNVLPQSSLLSSGFVIDNADDVKKLLEKYHVTLNLSGHSHLQHESGDGSFTDICTESISLYPIPFAVIIIQDGSWDYQQKHLDLLQSESKERFLLVSEKQLTKELASLNIDSSIKAAMIHMAANANLAYFSGDTDSLEKYLNSKEMDDWRQYAGGSFWYLYMSSMNDG